MKFILILTLLLLCVHGQQQNNNDNNNNAFDRSATLLRTLHYKMTREIAPLESEAFMYQLGGLTLDGTYFDDLSWRKLRNFTGDSPQFALHSLTDDIPSVSTWMVSKGSLSERWGWLFASYEWQDAIWEHARCTLLEATDPDVDELHAAEFEWLGYAEQLIDLNHTLYAQCTKRFGKAICADQAELRTEATADAFDQFVALNVSSAPLDEQFRILHACNGDVIMMNALAVFDEWRRAELGQFAELAPFMHTEASPQRWWMWFVDLTGTQAAADNSSSSSSSTNDYEKFYRDEKLIELVPPVEEYFASLNASDAAQPPLVHWTWSAMGGDTGQDDVALSLEALTERCDSLRIDADVARVDIVRPWFDPLLLRQVKPLAMRGLNVSQWSNGELHTTNADNVLPLHSVAMIVARNVCFVSDSWDEYFVEDLVAASNHSSVDGQEVFVDDQEALVVGPFTLLGDALHFGLRGASRNASLRALPNGAGFCIAQPLIVGWVVRATPLAPTDVFHDNFELGRCDASVLEPWNNTYPPDHCLVTLNQFANNDTLGQFDDDSDIDDDGAEDDDGLRYLDARGARAWVPSSLWSNHASTSSSKHSLLVVVVFFSLVIIMQM